MYETAGLPSIREAIVSIRQRVLYESVQRRRKRKCAFCEAAASHTADWREPLTPASLKGPARFRTVDGTVNRGTP